MTQICLFCQEEESVSHLLYDCIYAQKIWKIVNDVFHLRHAISHDDVIFGVDLDLSMNYVSSILILAQVNEHTVNQQILAARIFGVSQNIVISRLFGGY